MQTPWGKPDFSTRYERGIVFYSTPSHGGFHISPTRLREMPEPLRNPDGWYEEDCEAAKVLIAFPHLFGPEQTAQAKDSLRHWFPEIYEQLYGVTLEPGESFTRDQQYFHEAHAHDWVVIAAWGDWYEKARPGYCYVLATRGGSRTPGSEQAAFLVPSAEYDERSRYGFVIDPARHQKVQ